MSLQAVWWRLTPDERERMYALCAQIAKEKDQHHFEQLVHELNDLLERKEHGLEIVSRTQPGSAQSGPAQPGSAHQGPAKPGG